MRKAKSIGGMPFWTYYDVLPEMSRMKCQKGQCTETFVVGSVYIVYLKLVSGVCHWHFF